VAVCIVVDASIRPQEGMHETQDELQLRSGKVKAGLQHHLKRSGPLAMSVNQSGGFFRSDAAQKHPNIQLYFIRCRIGFPRSARRRSSRSLIRVFCRASIPAARPAEMVAEKGASLILAEQA
jgi:hypothetical protein